MMQAPPVGLSRPRIQPAVTLSAPQTVARFGSTPPAPEAAGAPEIQQALATFPRFGPPPFNPAFHKDRREKFLAQLAPNTAVVIVGGKEIRRNNDVNYPFRQQNNFYYLTGFDEPNAVALLQNTPGKPRFTLFVPPRDPSQEVWTGRRSGPEGAKAKYGANDAYTTDQLFAALPGLIEGSQNLQLIAAESTLPDAKSAKPMSHWSLDISRYLQQLRPNQSVGDASDLVAEMRVSKTPYEIALLKQACQISARAHARTIRTQKLTATQMQKSPSRAMGRNEGEIQAHVEYQFRRHGAVRAGYPSISGASGNGCVLHYVTNSDFAKPGDLVLLDAGAEYGYYTSDITRTWPVSGQFTPEQKAVYNVVLKAQEAGIQKVRPGVTLEEIHNTAVRVVTEGLVELGLLQGNVEDLIRDKKYTKFFMHGTSHFLGMDVHDTSGSGLNREQGKKRPLAAGMALTVEPGIYIDPAMAKQEGIDPKWWNIGVRIEDDILVTPTGHENLSVGVPKTVEAIEALMGTKA